MAAYMKRVPVIGLLVRNSILQNIRTNHVAKYAKKAGKAAAKLPEPVVYEAKDPQELVKYCVGLNYMKEGPEVELKPDSEYPEWLWDLHIGPPQKLEELDPDTRKYWRKIRKMHIKRNNALSKNKKF
ncbi:39S ribosomal protein L54, mitochondrial-like [Anneissia japonica]|uniref:39S ribosomal protein L54, mitochondrial-like n=1 Tax=Anneissia japonica TaxID=1529436 RepID=UPI0014259630|nr:39S ribosomal protein L54, mitochondrial-like [Anneissia japonica]